MEKEANLSIAQTGLSVWTRRYHMTLKLSAAAFFGLIVFPVIFLALQGHDVLLGGRISLVDLVWLILALAACVIMFRARAALEQTVACAVDRLLVSLPEEGEPLTGSSVSGSSAKREGDAKAEGRTVAQGLLDLVFLLAIQATLRVPLVGVISGLAPQAWVDGLYVLLVVVLAIVILVNVNRAGKPLVEHLTWLGLNQFVPTAGFAANSVTAAFTIRLATTSSPLSSSPRSFEGEPAPPDPSAISTETLAAAETVAADPEGQSRPADDEATVRAPDPSSVSLEATVVAPGATETTISGATAIIVEPTEATKTIVADPVPADKPRTH